MTVLIVDDEPDICRIVQDQLQDRGLLVTVAGTVAEATAAVASRPYQVVILDLHLPDGSGMEVLDLLRSARSTAHVIVLSGAGAEHVRLEALDRGADDFVAKPFFPRELTARVLAVQRRQNPGTDAPIELGHCTIDLHARQVTRAGEAVDLTSKEFDLLAYLAARPGKVFSREELLNAVWRSTTEWQQPSTVTEHVRRLRNKIEVDPASPTLLLTVRGAGYRLDLPVRRA